jgi:hypothetical protein
VSALTKVTKVTVNSILPGPTCSEANDRFNQSTASTPNATFEQAEKEFCAKQRRTSLLQRMIPISPGLQGGRAQAHG